MNKEKRATIIALNKLGVTKDYEFVHAVSVENLKNLQSGAKITLPKGVIAKREYDSVIFSIPSQEKCQEEIPFKEGVFNLLGKTIEISATVAEKPYLLFDGDKIPVDAVIRTRRDGDVFTKFGGGTKKLKDFFIDKKIPVRERDFIPVIATGNKILVVLGVEISDDVKITNNSTNVIKATLIKE